MAIKSFSGNKMDKKTGKKDREKQKSLQDSVKDLKAVVVQEKRDKESLAKEIIHKKQEDEVFAMMYGPNWNKKAEPKAEPDFEEIKEEQEDFSSYIKPRDRKNMDKDS